MIMLIIPGKLKPPYFRCENCIPDKKITGIFQPHLYTRTRDLADDFAESLSLLDELILLDIYPARELPIQGVTAEMIFSKVKPVQQDDVQQGRLAG